MSDEDDGRRDDVQRAIGRIEGSLSRNQMILQDIRTDLIRHFEDDKQAFNRIGDRVSAVERKVWWFTGGAGAIAFLVGKFTGKL